MALSEACVGRTYGPFTSEVGLEKVREFAAAISGGVPTAAFPSTTEGTNPLYFDVEKARASKHGSVLAPPTFAVVFALRPFAAASMDAELGIDLMKLVHGEQEFEFVEPVRPGDTMTTVGTISAAYSKSGKDFLVMTTESKNQHGRVAVRGVWTAVIRQ